MSYLAGKLRTTVGSYPQASDREVSQQPVEQDRETCSPRGPLRLSAALDETIARLALARVELAVSINDWTLILDCSRREIERMRSAGKLPPADFHIGKMPRWLPSTVQAWMGSQAACGQRRAVR